MQEEGHWITINGTHVFVKDGQDPMDAFIRQKAKNKKEDEENIEATHITNIKNIDSIKKHGFDLTKAGTGAGTTFGKGVYFSTEENEQKYWQYRIDNGKEIKANINTTGFLKVEYNDYTNGNNYINSVVDNFTDSEKKQYRALVKQYKQDNKMAQELHDKGDTNYRQYWHIDEKQDAMTKILQENYPGLIVKQNTEKMDVITGGNQIVVYDTSRIKIKE